MADDDIDQDEGTMLLRLESKKPSKVRMITVEPLAVLFGVAYGTSFFAQTIYIEDRLASDRNYTLSKDDSVNGTCDMLNTSDPDYIIQQDIAADLSTWAMIIQALLYFPVLLLTPFYGVLCDRVGRKLNFTLPLLAYISYCLIVLLTVYLHLPLAVLAFGNFMQGLGGSHCFFDAGCFTYISDISTDKIRLVRLAIVYMVFILSLGTVQVFADYLLNYSIAAAFWFSFASALAALFYVLIPGVLLETVTSDKSRNTPSFGEVIRAVYTLLAVKTNGRNGRLILLLVIYFITALFHLSSSATAIYGLYGLGPPFCWSSSTLANFNLVYLVSTAIGLLACSKAFSMCFKDHWILQLAYLFGCLSHLMAAWAPSTALFVLALVLGSPRGMDTPVIASILSKLVTTQELGTLFAIQSSVQSAANFLSSLILNPIYSASVDTNPSLIFNIIAAVFFILIILTWIWMGYSRKVMQTESTTTKSATSKSTTTEYSNHQRTGSHSSLYQSSGI